MKVLMLSWEFPPKIVGGLGVVVYNLSKHLLQKGCKIKIALPFDPQNKEFAKHIIPVFKRFEMEYHVYSRLIVEEEVEPSCDLLEATKAFARRVAKICKHLSFDVIHAHEWLTFEAGLLLKKLTGKPLVVHVHATEFDRAGGGRGHPKIHEIEQSTFEKTDMIIAVSKRVKNWIVKEYKIPEEKVKVVYNAVEKIPYSEFPETLRKVVLYVGRLSLMKGPDYFLKAAKKVLEKEKDACFVVVGKGEMMHQLMEEACALGIADKVLFTGFIEREKLINGFYRYADVLVMPSLSEPFGLTALEAIANGVPVIVSKQSGVAEVIKHCFKVDFWDINEMANKIIALLRYKPLKEIIRKESLKELEKLSWNKQAEEIIKIYEAVS